MANYTLSEKEKKDADTSIKKHKKCNPKHSTPFKYIFTPTGIGNAVTIKCPCCGEEKDITDVSCW
jgi:hypothetical protein